MLHELSYPITIRPFEGDWYDAANIYRDWVLPNSFWTKKGRLLERNETPKWAYNITTWLMDAWPSPSHQQFVLDFLNTLDLEKGSLGIHFYNWDFLGF